VLHLAQPHSGQRQQTDHSCRHCASARKPEIRQSLA
jgi:hypothetical protein